MDITVYDFLEAHVSTGERIEIFDCATEEVIETFDDSDDAKYSKYADETVCSFDTHYDESAKQIVIAINIDVGLDD